MLNKAFAHLYILGNNIYTRKNSSKAFICSKLTIAILEKGVKYGQI